MEALSSSIIDLRDVVAVYNGYPALAGVNLHVKKGEIVLLQGPNGAGKSTLLRLCAGLLPVERGTAFILGCNVQDEREQVRSRVGFAWSQQRLVRRSQHCGQHFVLGEHGWCVAK